MFRRSIISVIVLSIGFALSACGGSTASDSKVVETQVTARIFATLTAIVPTLTNTPQPTATPEATATPESTTTTAPTSTPTDAPTATLEPTPTPELTLSIPARGAYKHHYEIIEKYDKFSGDTVVTLLFSPGESYTSGKPNGILAYYGYPGQTPSSVSNIGFHFAYVGDHWKFMECYGTDLLLNGTTRLNLQAEYEGRVLDAGGVLEYIGVKDLPLEIFLEIVNAKTVEVKICNDEFTLTDAQLSALKDFTSRMQ